MCMMSIHAKHSRKRKQRPQLIVLTGFSGSGKSTVGETMSTQMDAALFPLDLCLIERDKRRNNSFLGKFAFQEADYLCTTLMAGHPITFTGYSQVTAKRDQEITIEPRPLLIVEGVLPFSVPVIQNSPHLAMWVHSPLSVCEQRQYMRARCQGWYAGLTEQEIVKRVEQKRTAEIPLILQQQPRCHLVVDNSGNDQQEMDKEPTQNSQDAGMSILLVIANDAQKPALSRILAANTEIITARYSVIAGTTASLALAKEIFPQNKCFEDLGHGREWGDSFAMTYLATQCALGHCLEAIALFDPYLEAHQPWKTALLLSCIKANIIWMGNEATAMAFYRGLREKK